MDLKKLLLNEANTNLSYIVSSPAVSFESATNKLWPELTIYKGATFKPDGKGNLVTKTKFNFKDSTSGGIVSDYDDYMALYTYSDPNEIKYHTYTENIIYKCNTGKFSVPSKSPYEYFAENSPAPELKNKLDNLCKLSGTSGGDGNKPKPDSQKIKDNAIKCGWKNQDGSADVNGYKGSGWECPKPGVPKPKPNVQRPNVQNVVKQIQQNLNQEQTGQFTTKDIQDIIIKLGGKAESPVMTEEINRIRMIMNLVVEQVDLDSIIKQNVKSEVVTQLQELLKTKYSEDIIVDGYFGPKTANALLNSLSKIPTNVNQTNTTQPDTTQPERLQTVSAVDAAKGLKPTGTLRGT
jgi:hypothetical protein